MCDSMPQLPADRIVPALIICQGLFNMNQEWVKLEGIREQNHVEKIRLKHERRKLQLQLKAFKEALGAQVSMEQSRADTFIAVMAAVPQIGDQQAAFQALEMAREILDRGPAITLNWERT